MVLRAEPDRADHPTGQVAEFGELPRVGETYTNIVAVAGSLWFTESGGTVSADASTRGARSPSTHSPTAEKAFTAGPDGSVWIAADTLMRITPAGAVTAIRIPRKARPSSIVTGPDGNLAVHPNSPTKPDRRITPTGQLTSYGGVPTLPRWATAQAPTATCSSTGYQDNRIWRITPTGQVTSYGGLPTDAVPGAAHQRARDGNLWFVYRDHFQGRNHSLGRITPTGVITEYRLPGPDLGSLTAGPDNTLWFTAEHEDAYYPSAGKFGRVTIARLAGGHPLTTAAPTN